MATIIGILAFAITMAYVSFGFPLQIARVVRRRSAADLSFSMHVLGLCTFAIWVLYAVSPASGPVWEIAVPNSAGFVGEVWVLGLCWRYRARSGSQPAVPVALEAGVSLDAKVGVMSATDSAD